MSLKGSNYPTVRPSLDLQFAQTKRLDPRISYSRSGVATYYDETGILRTAQANQARFDHDPTTGESLGLLVEEARTNTTQRSNSVNKNPSTSPQSYAISPPQYGASVSFYRDIAPDDTFNSTYLYLGRYNQYSLQGGLNYASNPKNVTISFWIKAAPQNTLGSLTLIPGTFSSDRETIYYDNTWKRFTKTVYLDADNMFFNLYAENFSSPNILGIQLWGLQLEEGSFPTSYIPTPATFTSRSSTATYYDANGVIQTAGINVARDDAYFPDENGVMQPAGLLLEAAGTNLMTYSEQFDNVAWDTHGGVGTKSTVLSNQITAPDGTTTADLIQSNGSASGRTQFFSSASGTTYTFSVFAKKANSSTATFYLDRYSGDWGPGSSAPYVFYNFDTNVVSSNATSVIVSAQRIGNGWVRLSVTATKIGTGGSYCGWTGGPTDDVYAWGAQVETSSFPTSYIPTTSSTVTRAADVSSSSTVTRGADVAQITGSNFSSWFDNKKTGSLFYDVTLDPGNQIIANKMIIAMSTSLTSWNGPVIGSWRSGGSTYTETNGGFTNVWVGPSFSARTKICIGYKLGIDQSNMAANGTLYGAKTTTNPVVNVYGTHGLPTGLFMGGGGRHYISQLTYYPARLPDATLQKLTE